ncbi:MAG: hypothetical protein M1834_002712 [Cirrosporium novae-zelandiae]|nr:MAG: hypothetical protein M1834_002712 [Cirrosporium novae-zelandiae]
MSSFISRRNQTEDSDSHTRSPPLHPLAANPPTPSSSTSRSRGRITKQPPMNQLREPSSQAPPVRDRSSSQTRPSALPRPKHIQSSNHLNRMRAIGLGIETSSTEDVRPGAIRSASSSLPRCINISKSFDESAIKRRPLGTRKASTPALSSSRILTSPVSRDKEYDPFPGTVLGVTLPFPPTLESKATFRNLQYSATRPSITSDHGSHIQNNSIRTPPPLTHSSTPFVDSPSTRYSESPSIFSRASSTTPASATSTSPCIVQYAKAERTVPRPSSDDANPHPLPHQPTDYFISTAKIRESQGESDRGRTVSQNRHESFASKTSVSTASSDATLRDKAATSRQHLPPAPPPRKSSRLRQPQPSRGTAEVRQDDTISSGNRSFSTEASHMGRSTARKGSSSREPSSNFRPLRPSREDIPELSASELSSPIIQINLPRKRVVDRRQRISERSHTSSDTEKDENIAKKPQLVTNNSNSPPRLIPELRHMRITPSSIVSRDSDLSYLETVTPVSSVDIPPRNESDHPSSRKLKSPFNFLSRHAKSQPKQTHSSTATLPPSRKGPAAGTGHEGYGKYAYRGRRPSISTNSSRGRSTSTSKSLALSDSGCKSSITSGSESEVDEFLKERLAPVVLRGGMQQTEGHHLALSNHSDEDSVQSMSSMEQAMGRPTLLSDPRGSYKQLMLPLSPGHVGISKKPSFENLSSIRRKFEKEPTTIAERRTFSRSNLFPFPTPIDTTMLVATPPLNSHDTSLSSLPDTDDPLVYKTGKLRKQQESLAGPKHKKGLLNMSRWMFPRKSKDSVQILSSPEAAMHEMRAAVSPISSTHAVAHYAITDSLEDIDPPPLDAILKEIEESRTSSDSNGELNYATSQVNVQRVNSILLPPPPLFSTNTSGLQRPPSPKVSLHRGRLPEVGETKENVPQKRVGRLSQVGRIPKVVSRRDHEHKPSAASFSRPFSKVPLQNSPPAEDSVIGLAEVVGKQAFNLDIKGYGTERPFASLDCNRSLAMLNPEPLSLKSKIPGQEEFLSFPPRKISETSGSSSSGVIDFSTNTNQLSDLLPGLSDDEIWDEFDDLIDHALSPISPRSSFANCSKPTISTDQTTPVLPQNQNKVVDRKGKGRALNNTDPASPINILTETRNSIIPPRLTWSPASSTPYSLSDFYAAYGDRNLSSSEISALPSPPMEGRRLSSEANYYASRPLPSVDASGQTRYQNTRLLDLAERQRYGPAARSNLRFGALMTSRWLSFGRVLFSPAHDEVSSTLQNNILVIDGLGSDDWSFYCALTYSNATVYSISPRPPLDPSADKTKDHGGALPATWQSLPNHRRIFHPTNGQSFPFPKGFFTAVVFRFPPASSESSYRSTIAECKRVLRPGGYLELSALDLDMLNMGDKTRRAIRKLKTRMQAADPDVSLRPTSDNLQRLLGRRGFENLNRCMVGIPVARGVRNSGSISSSDEHGLSLDEMLKDPSAKGDEDITKMIARVGRWWYTRCYELGVLPEGRLEGSIWSDRGLLRECEKRMTGFKMLICYAQKPVLSKRRTVSL